MAKTKSAKVSKDGVPIKRHIATDKKDYEVSITKLNDLQSNAKSISISQNQGPLSHVQQTKKVEETSKYLNRIGLDPGKLDKLSVIHIAGTKGKGTTAAMCESILRHHGYRTGLFTSPHLVEVRERIRLNGMCLSHRKFAEYFNSIHSLLTEKKENDSDMPAYFKFLTVMAFQVFLAEQVDVAIMEVGIGGEYDCTNCIRKPAVVGISTLGLDHTSILGNTLEEIAWQKAGIMKPGAPAFTVPQPSPAATNVLWDRALNRQCTLSIVPSLESYTWERDPTMTFTNMIEDVYTSNASLALQLANEWLKQQSPYSNPKAEVRDQACEIIPVAQPFHISKNMTVGLERCTWPGRTQILRTENITYFLDSAHTDDSIAYCLHWFLKAAVASQTSPEMPHKILIFNTTGSRNNSDFLSVLHKGDFDLALFPAITPIPNISSSSDHFSKKSDDKLSYLKNLASLWSGLNKNNKTQICLSVSEALESVRNTSGPCQVLVTGSVHLVGAALSLLDPCLSAPSSRVSASLKPLNKLYSTIQAAL